MPEARLVAVGVLLTILLAPPATAADDPAAAVRAVLDTQVACWNRGDLDGFTATYWNSPKLVFQSGGDRTEGFDGMRERYRRRYKAEGKVMGTLAFSDVEILMLAPDAAMARGRWQLTMPDATRPRGLYTLLLHKLPEGWKIVHDHTSSAP